MLLDLIEHLRDCGQRKLCIASRPENLLYQRLQQYLSFKMQDHNSTTIRDYVEVTFQKPALSNSNNLDVTILVDDVVTASEGVVLWTHLITNQLVTCITAGGTTNEVYDEFERFPRELDEVYATLFSHIDPRWQVQTALFLVLIQTAVIDPTAWDLHCAMVYLRDCGWLKP